MVEVRLRSLLVAVVAAVLIVALPGSAGGHPGVLEGAAEVAPEGRQLSPGGLDRRGGHHCWTRCSRYGLYTGQYHCHRKPCGKRDIKRHRRHGH